MKTVALFTLLIVAATLMGCTTDPCDPCGRCGTLNANCCGWEFYKPCHKISGRTACNDDCNPGQQIVLKGCDTTTAAPAEADVVEEVPATAPAVEATPDDQ